MDSCASFLRELDLLKLVERKTYIDGGVRRENSAEHSWHLAMACWSIANQFSLNISQEKLIKLALIHDLGEIDAGDTFYIHQSDLKRIKKNEMALLELRHCQVITLLTY